MTFKQARKRFDAMADGKYRAIRFEVTTNSYGEKRIECQFYIDGPGWTNNKNTTWESALSEMQSLIDGIVLADEDDIAEAAYGVDLA